MTISFPFAITDPRLEALVDPAVTRVEAYNPPTEPEDKRNEGNGPKGPKSGPKQTR